MKKLLGKSTKRLEQEAFAVENTAVQAKGRSKRKVLKVVGVASLAILMGFGATMAFVPIGTSTSVNAHGLESEYTTEHSQGLITPKADDPVLFTTEDGLEIKWGNDTSSTTIMPGGQLSSGNLSGFPYFTTTAGTTTYTWVIIGRNADVKDIFIKPNSSYVFSSWKSTHNVDDTWYNTNAYYFFNNTYENTTPAGSAIDTTVASSAYVSDLTKPIIQTNTSTEIPSGCVLVLANDNVETGVANTNASTYYRYNSSNRYYTHHSTYYGQLPDTMNSYYNNDTFGFGEIKSRIQAVSLLTNGVHGSGRAVFSYASTTTTNYIFPLSCANDSNFKWSTYLTAAQMKLSSTQWCRDGVNSSSSTGWWSGSYYYSYPHKYYIDTNGANQSATCNNSAGYRPAFCFKVT